MDKILEVKNLSVGFRTTHGTVKAVRDISFDLERGKTLAIVGESGSGKSVTSKAIIGILAGNSIVESGEILYDGNDLLRITEDEMHKIRGDKISMIFQDPLSSLNPIVKIGKQITEAMLLKNKANRKEARRAFNAMLAELKKNIIEACGKESEARVSALSKKLDDICIQATKLDNSYTEAFNKANELIANIEDLIYKAGKKQNVYVVGAIREYKKELAKVKDEFLTAKYDARIAESIASLNSVVKAAAAANNTKNEMPEEVEKALRGVQNLLKEVTAQTKPDFFRIALYYLDNNLVEVKNVSSVEELNAKALTYLNDNFMKEFLSYADNGVEHSFKKALENKKLVLEQIPALRAFFEGEFTQKNAMARCKEMSKLIASSIDRLEIIKDSAAYAFEASLSNAIERFFSCQVGNRKEEARFARQSKRRERLVARGRKVEWKVVPKNVYSVSMLRENILTVINRIEERYTAYIANAETVDFDQRAIEMVDYFKARAAETVYRVTKSMAKEQAIKLMEEVGIHEPRTRFYQYPFEFSGGMRQRIVIAIALAANPDILICDEPTTALDVTIQAQILELINNLKKERNLSVIFITHDLGVVANMADDIAVMYAGKIVEYGTADDIFYDPRHPYTWALLSSMPDLETTEKLDAIPGTPPNMIYPPVGDAFADRNKFALKIDFEQQPPFFEVTKTHKAATWLLHPDAPKAEVPQIITDRIARMKKAGGAQHAE